MDSLGIKAIKGLSAAHKEVLTRTCQLLQKQIPTKILLFGSCSRDQAREDSDIDLLILVEEKVSRNLKNDVTAVIYPLELEYDLEINPLIVNRQEWEEGRYCRHPLHIQVEEEGILL